MKTVEFKTKISNGIIKLPDEFKNHSGKEIRVILLFEEKHSKQFKHHHFTAAKIKTKNFVFNREEA